MVVVMRSNDFGRFSKLPNLQFLLSIAFTIVVKPAMKNSSLLNEK
jgi:hypothetical protein